MNDTTTVIGIFIILTLLFSFGANYFIRSFFLSALASTFLTVACAQLAFYFYHGYVDPFISISSMTMGAVALIVFLMVGVLPFFRKKRQEKRHLDQISS